ncbi:MAG: CotH kinase family protein [Oscillospiraceae bacterium]|nr:CotH kinase family protein [Oscillospiraceae bacterium]
MERIITKKVTTRMTAVVTALIMMAVTLVSILPFAWANESQSIIILQAYGQGGNPTTLQTDTPISHNFIELYNPTNAAVNLSGWKITYEQFRRPAENGTWEHIFPSGTTMPPNSSYLIRGRASVVDSAHPAPNHQVSVGDLEMPSMYLDNAEYRVQIYSPDNALVNQIHNTTVTNKHTTLRKTDLSGTGHTAIDYRTLAGNPDELERVRPRSISDGGWNPFPEKETPDDLVIAMAYSGAITELGVAADSPVTHSFVEIYNPTDTTISLDGYYLHYQGFPVQQIERRTGTSWGSLKLDGTKSIPPKHSYLINCGVNTSHNTVILSVFDQVWESPPPFVTKGAKYLLTKGVSSVPAASVDPFTANGGKPIEGYIDMVGSAGNDTGTTDQIDGCETSYFGLLTSRQLGIIRKDRDVDTDNNADDFETVDFRTSPLRPRTLADGPFSDVAIKGVVFNNEYPQVGVPFTARVDNNETGETFTYEWRVGVEVVVVRDDTAYEAEWIPGGSVVGGNSNTYTPTANDLEKFITLKATSSLDGEVYEKSVYFSTLPVVYIDVVPGQQPLTRSNNRIRSTEGLDYAQAALRIQGSDDYNSTNSILYDGMTGIRARGNATRGAAKTPYKLRLNDRASVFGMTSERANRHWVMLAEYNDRSLIRNRLSQEFARRQSDNFVPGMVSVVCVLNGIYDGVYTFAEQIRVDQGRIDIYKWDDVAEDIIAAVARAKGYSSAETADLEDYVLENTSWISTGRFTYKSETFILSDYGIALPADMSDPDNLGGILLEHDHYNEQNDPIVFETNGRFRANESIPENIANSGAFFENTKAYLNAFEAAVLPESSPDFYAKYNNKDYHYSDLFDMDSLVQYFFANEIPYNADNMKNSVYWYKGIDEKAKFGPAWDFDWSMGVWWVDGGSPWSDNPGNQLPYNRWASITTGGQPSGRPHYYRQGLLRDPVFLVRAYEHWRNIRRTAIEDLVKHDGWLDQLAQKMQGPAAANHARWAENYSRDRRDGRAKATAAQEIQTTVNYFRNRVSWIDKKAVDLDTFVQSFRSYPDNPAGGGNPMLYNKSGQLDILSISTIRGGNGKSSGEVEITARLGDSNMARGQFFINGKKVGQPVNKNGNTVSIIVPHSALATGRKATNVVVIRALNEDGSYNRNQPTPNAVVRSAFDVFETPLAGSFIPGNPTNTEGGPNIGDILLTRDYIFRRADIPAEDQEAAFLAMDMNQDGIIDIFDMIRIRDLIVRG